MGEYPPHVKFMPGVNPPPPTVQNPADSADHVSHYLPVPATTVRSQNQVNCLAGVQCTSLSTCVVTSMQAFESIGYAHGDLHSRYPYLRFISGRCVFISKSLIGLLCVSGRGSRFGCEHFYTLKIVFKTLYSGQNPKTVNCFTFLDFQLSPDFKKPEIVPIFEQNHNRNCLNNLGYNSS
jgi:hypothetical protein